MFGWLKKFSRSTEGNIAVMTAFAAVPMLVVAFGTVNFADGIGSRKNLQFASDQAVLAAALQYRGRWRDQQNTARNLFRANLRNRARYGRIQAKLNRTVSKGKLILKYAVAAETPPLVNIFQGEKTPVLSVVSMAEVDLRGKSYPRLIDPDNSGTYEQGKKKSGSSGAGGSSAAE